MFQPNHLDGVGGLPTFPEIVSACRIEMRSSDPLRSLARIV
jgi:hypothetical protein